MNISVAMAVYKGERFIREQLNSIARQTVLPDEIVITDDSPDTATEQVIRDFATTVSIPVRYYRNEIRLGFPDNFFKAISLCEGKLIAFADQDDVWMAEKLERMRVCFDDPEVLLVSHAVSVVDVALEPKADGNESHWSYVGIHEPLTVDPWYILFGMCVMVRQEVFSCVDTNVRPADHTRDAGKMSHDLWAWFIGTSLGRYVALPEKLAMYRQHGTNVAGSPPEEGLIAKFRKAAKAGGEHYSRHGRFARERLATLTAIKTPQFAMKAQAAQAYYLALAERMDRRADLYKPSNSWLGRVRRLARLIGASDYRPVNQGGMGRKALVKDCYITFISPFDSTAKSK